MNRIPENSIVVIDISSKIFEILASNQELKTLMESIGFIHSEKSMIYFIKDEKDKIEKIQSLVNYGALFSFGYGWYPSEIIANYKDNGLSFGKYKVISWSDPNTYRIEEL